METHIVPATYVLLEDAFDDNYPAYVEVYFKSKTLAEEWIKQRIMADEIADELETYE